MLFRGMDGTPQILSPQRYDTCLRRLVVTYLRLNTELPYMKLVYVVDELTNQNVAGDLTWINHRGETNMLEPMIDDSRQHQGQHVMTGTQ
jgi:hypothetical protein